MIPALCVIIAVQLIIIGVCGRINREDADTIRHLEDELEEQRANVLKLQALLEEKQNG